MAILHNYDYSSFVVAECVVGLDARSLGKLAKEILGFSCQRDQIDTGQLIKRWQMETRQKCSEKTGRLTRELKLRIIHSKFFSQSVSLVQ